MSLPYWKPAIVLDGKPQAKMQIGGHTLLTVEAGRHELSVAPDNWKDDVSITFLARPNSKRFFKLSTDVKNISTFGQSWTEVMRLTEVPEAQALKEISQTSYIAPRHVAENK